MITISSAKQFISMSGAYSKTDSQLCPITVGLEGVPIQET